MSLLELARSTIEDPEDAYIEAIDNSPDGKEFTKLLQLKIESLINLDISRDDAAESRPDEEETRAGAIMQDLPAHQYFAGLMTERFPAANHQLVEALSLSNWSRYNHVKREREFVLINSDANATGAAKSEFHDSGIGSASSAHSVYAATVVSSRAEESHKRLPPLPKQAREGEPFMCEVCERVMTVRRTRECRYELILI